MKAESRTTGNLSEVCRGPLGDPLSFLSETLSPVAPHRVAPSTSSKLRAFACEICARKLAILWGCPGKGFARGGNLNNWGLARTD